MITHLGGNPRKGGKPPNENTEPYCLKVERAITN